MKELTQYQKLKIIAEEINGYRFNEKETLLAEFKALCATYGCDLPKDFDLDYTRTNSYGRVTYGLEITSKLTLLLFSKVIDYNSNSEIILDTFIQREESL